MKNKKFLLNRIRHIGLIRPIRLILILVVLFIGGFLFFKLTTKPTTAAWYGTSGWSYRQKLTINHDQVSGGPLTLFPVLVKVTDLKLRAAQTTGNDFLFTSSDGSTKIPHEIEKFDQTTGSLVAWVGVTVSSTTDTVIYMYYGNQSAADQSNKTAVWDADYVGVWHLAETAGHHKDSTGKQADSTAEGEASRGVTGITGGAVSFDGTGSVDHMISIPSSSDLTMTTDYTIEAWTNPSILNNGGSIIHKCPNTGCTTTPYSAYRMTIPGTGSQICFWSRTSGDGTAKCSNTLTTGNWYYIADTGQISTNVSNATIYQNGSQVGTPDNATGTIVANDSNPFYLGDSGYRDPYGGILDEVRYSKIVRSAGWLLTTYNTINSPSTFLTFGSQEKSEEPVAYWKLDDGHDWIASDSGSLRADGTIVAATWQGEDLCISGKCLNFPGGTTASVSVSKTIDNIQSISLWVKSATTSAYLANLGSSSIQVVSGTVSAPGITSPTIYVNGISGGTLTANQWTHIEVTTGTAVTATNPVFGVASNNYLKGFMDEIKFYDYVRNIGQVKADYSNGSSKGSSVKVGGPSTGSGPLSQGLVGYWKMDEATWTGAAGEVLDASGNGNNGIASCLGGGCTKPTTGAGKFGNGGVFSGSTNYDYVSVPYNTSFGITTDMTISTWIKRNGTNTLDGLLAKTDGSSWDYDLLICDNTTDYDPQCPGNVNKVLFYSTNGSPTRTFSTGTIADTSWHHLVVSRSSSANTVSFYIDGQPSGTSTMVGNFSNHSYPLSIGTDYPVVWYDAFPFFSGSLDELRIYNRALSPAEVRQLYNFAPGPVAYYKFEEGAGQAIVDSSGNSLNGTWAGTGDHWTTGKFGKAGGFDGTNDYAELPTSKLDSNYGSVSLWFKNAYDYSDAAMMFYGVDAAGAGGNGMGDEKELSIHLSSSEQIYLWIEGGASDVGIHTTTSYKDDRWHHVEATWDINGSAFLYVDGVLIGSATHDAYSFVFSGLMRLGRPGADTRYFKGSLDDVKIYNYARTPDQIMEDMQGRTDSGISVQGVSSYGKGTLIDLEMDNVSGTTVYDQSGNAKNGTLNDGPVWTQNGKFGKGINLDGSNDDISIPDFSY